MDLVPRRAGEVAVTPAAGGRRAALALYALAVLLTAAAVVLSAAIWQDRGSEAAVASDTERYADVLASATAEAEAFINIRYDRAQESIDAVAEGATGQFKEQYDESTAGVLEVLERNRSVMEGEVVWAGVVDADADSATVLVATSGTVANAQTDDEPVARAFRLRLELALVEGRWLTSDLQFVA